jgi:hypothetical protein
LFDQLFLIWRQLDTLGPQLSLASCQSCKDHNPASEFHWTYGFLTQFHDEFEPLCAHLLAHHSCVSLMDALAKVRNEETHLYDAGLLQSSSVFVAPSSIAHPIAPIPLTSLLATLPTAQGEGVGLHYDHCGWDGHVETFCYRKRKAQKAQARHSS